MRPSVDYERVTLGWSLLKIGLSCSRETLSLWILKDLSVASHFREAKARTIF
jgi:hypothetical protein